jgi:hypothetical protein
MAAAVTVAGALPATAAQEEAAQEPTAIPEVVQIEDPAGDANYLNGQGLDESQKDHVTPADAGSVSDLIKVWFTNDADFVNVHVLTEVVPPADTSAYIFRVAVDPGSGANCLWFQIFTDGPTNPAGAFGTLRDTCTEDVSIGEGVTVKFEESADGQGISTISVPRSAHAALMDGATLGTPVASVRNLFNPGPASMTAPQIDDTLPGTSYSIVTEEAPKVVPKKKGCKKGSVKAKRKGCKK